MTNRNDNVVPGRNTPACLDQFVARAGSLNLSGVRGGETMAKTVRRGSPEALDLQQTSADADQSLADTDQTLSDADQALSGADRRRPTEISSRRTAIRRQPTASMPRNVIRAQPTRVPTRPR